MDFYGYFTKTCFLSITYTKRTLNLNRLKLNLFHIPLKGIKCTLEGIINQRVEMTSPFKNHPQGS